MRCGTRKSKPKRAGMIRRRRARFAAEASPSAGPPASPADAVLVVPYDGGRFLTFTRHGTDAVRVSCRLRDAIEWQEVWHRRQIGTVRWILENVHAVLDAPRREGRP
jgi:hypothetical protein